jgi:hypothetical protein
VSELSVVLKRAALSTIYVVGIFVVAMVAMVLILDVVLAPILVEMFLGPDQRDWCGIWSRCASKTHPSFFAYLWSGTPWRRIDSAAIVDRAALAAGLGVIVGFSVSTYSYLSSRR